MRYFVKSPLNYIGGKHKLLPQILPTFPKGIRRFVDLFAGGFNVGVNVEAEKIYCNDILTPVTDFYKYLQVTPFDRMRSRIFGTIEEWGLTNTDKKAYLKFRKHWNKTRDPLEFFVLLCYAFNNQARFNSNLEFNSAFGKIRSKYNNKIEENLKLFQILLNRKNVKISNKSFDRFDFDKLEKDDFIYCDPPYLITEAYYNNHSDTEGWGERQEKRLLQILDTLDDRGVGFALSNVITYRGKENRILSKWSRKYYVSFLECDYSNAIYSLKEENRKGMTQEVLITNYKTYTPKKNLTPLFGDSK